VGVLSCPTCLARHRRARTKTNPSLLPTNLDSGEALQGHVDAYRDMDKAIAQAASNSPETSLQALPRPRPPARWQGRLVNKLLEAPGTTVLRRKPMPRWSSAPAARSRTRRMEARFSVYAADRRLQACVNQQNRANAPSS
jgi:hypothetical protein